MDPRPPLPSVQTAYRIVRKGDPATALVKDDNAPVPTDIPKGHVLVKVQAVSLNPMCAFLSSSIPLQILDLPQWLQVDALVAQLTLRSDRRVRLRRGDRQSERMRQVQSRGSNFRHDIFLGLD